MSDGKDIPQDPERHRLLLQENINSLRKALQHWRTWDAEYEALKEEVEAVPESTSLNQDLRRIHDTFHGEVLVARELDEIFGLQNARSKSQVVNVLDRRVDYVTQNITTLTQQLEKAENTYAEATATNQPDATYGDGHSITDIVEELDDEDNVLSYKLMTPGDALPHVKQALEKVQVGNVFKEGHEATPIVAGQDRQDNGVSSESKSSQTIRESQKMAEQPQKKTVSFVEDNTTEDNPHPQPSRRAKRVENIIQTAKEQEKQTIHEPIVPGEEDPEDAELRREMLKYSMSEIGAVVAELEIEEDDEGYSDDDAWPEEEDEELMDDDDDDADEDQFGRYTGRVITDAYRKRMLELEQRLGVKSRSALEPEANDVGSDEDESDHDEGIGRIVVQNPSGSTPSPSTRATSITSSMKERTVSASGAKKGVRFAEDLDVAPDSVSEKPITLQSGETAEPLRDIIERSTSAKSASAPKATQRQSRFRKTRSETTAPPERVPKGPMDVPPSYVSHQNSQEVVPSGPAGKTIADTLVEKDTVSAPTEPNGLDDSMIHYEVADAYQRLRNKFIQRQGGFLREDESAVQPLSDEEGQEPISRFKAARLSRH